ncbi:addiction module toxin, RelE/StbE family [Blautia obeum A2-162]|uniref:Addiction module toxin, RelE/StbE family n=1 Tax=Blautia obeum A2-162 TaxID=657314 RepID=D4LUC2_9FIRM|nr:addiction module toxin, RelE/StbE family [Blautia obeum A2-162]
MLKPEFTGQFKRDYKLAVKRGCNPKKLEEVITLLCNEQPLPEAYRDHALTNSRNYLVPRLHRDPIPGFRSLHVSPQFCHIIVQESPPVVHRLRLSPSP